MPVSTMSGGLWILRISAVLIFRMSSKSQSTLWTFEVLGQTETGARVLEMHLRLEVSVGPKNRVYPPMPI